MAVLLGLALFTTSCQQARRVTIVVDFGRYASADSAGRDEAHVDWTDGDTRDDDVCTLSFAALELQHYLRNATRDSLGFSIADDDSLPAGDLILVGGPDVNHATARLAAELRLRSADLATCGPEGYVIRSSRPRGRRIVVIAGGGRVGTLYGAYDFLHHMGVRWFAPGRVNEEVPSFDWRQVPGMSVRESPRFLTRGFHAWEDRGDENFLLWMARNRLNYWCIEQHQRPLLHKLGIALAAGDHGLTSLYLNPQTPYPYAHARFHGAADLPKDPYATSPEFLGDANGDGRLSYFEAHPEWYGLRDGRRSSNIVGDTGDNFCTSNPDAMTEWMKNAIRDLAVGHYREAGVVNAWLLDNGRWCSCTRCTALGTPTDRNLLFVNRFDREIRQARRAGRIRRPVKLFFLAYAELAAPPTRPLPPDFDTSTCIATFFPIVRCYAHRFSDPQCDVNAPYDAALRGWTTSADRYYRGRVCMGEYYNVSGYKSLPLCLMHTMQHDIPYYASLGIHDFHYMHCTTRNWGNKALTNWQMARQLWDPDTDCATLWDDYFAGRYGRAGPAMRRFYARLEAMLGNVSELKYGLARRLDEGLGPFFAGDRSRSANTSLSLTRSLRCARECRRILDDLPADHLSGRIRRRIAEDDRLFTYGERTLLLYDALCRASDGMRDDRGEAAAGALMEAERVANALKADTTSTRFSSSHANAPDALIASGVSHAVTRLASEMAFAAARDVKTFEPGTQPLVLSARDFSGGAIDPARGLAVYLEHAGWIEAGSGVCARRAMPAVPLAACFRLAAASRGNLYLSLSGWEHTGSAEREAHGEVLVNGYPVAAGVVPFADDRPSRVDVVVPAGFLERGVNRVEVRNLERGDAPGAAAWFGIERAEIRNTPPPRPAISFACRGPEDLALTYRSLVDGTEQPYRIYLPSAYDGKTRLPVLIALHGTGGSQGSFFDDSSYGNGCYQREAEKRGVIVVCPEGRGDSEYHGTGAVDVLQVMDQVKRAFCVDEDRIICSGHSMGGTGTTHLVTRYPDRFAAGIPVSSCYEHVHMLENLRHVPMLYIQGEYDWPVYAAEGPHPITTRLEQLGYDGRLWVVPKARHNLMRASTAAMMDWALRQRRVRDPERVTIKAYFPHEGKAYWAGIDEIIEPGYLAELDARIEHRNRIAVRTRNASRLAFRPDSVLLDLHRAISVEVNDTLAFLGSCSGGEEIVCSLDRGRWHGRRQPAALRPPVLYHDRRIGTVVVAPTQTSDPETSMGNWMTDMMRSVSGADVAIYNRRQYRGVPLRSGTDLYAEDLYDWIRPYDRRLCTFRCTGRDLREILEANILDEPLNREFLVQVCGCRYAFDRRRESGRRIVSTTLDPGRTYTVVCEGQVLSRETILLAGRFGKIRFTELEPSSVSAAWRYIRQSGGEVRAGFEGRVRDLTPWAPLPNANDDDFADLEPANPTR